MSSRLPPTDALSQVNSALTLALGIDIQLIDEIDDSLARFGDRYLSRLYTDLELEECDNSPDGMAESLALRFAAKEAVIKALAPHDHIPPWRTIEILLGPHGIPSVVLRGEAIELARSRGVKRFSLSASFGRGYAIATVVADVTKTIQKVQFEAALPD
jgi:holo-[acyl-carrier protein] synthase